MLFVRAGFQETCTYKGSFFFFFHCSKWCLVLCTPKLIMRQSVPIDNGSIICVGYNFFKPWFLAHIKVSKITKWSQCWWWIWYNSSSFGKLVRWLFVYEQETFWVARFLVLFFLVCLWLPREYLLSFFSFHCLFGPRKRCSNMIYIYIYLVRI